MAAVAVTAVRLYAQGVHQLSETTMNREKRTLLQVRLEDAVESEEIFSMLMGTGRGEPAEFIEDNALDVRNLDV